MNDQAFAVLAAFFGFFFSFGVGFLPPIARLLLPTQQ
jgi:hypothetical protein